MLKTPITYYGGKQGMLQHILPIIPDHDVYTEVFLGGGSVFWSKQPSKIETINDLSDFVINFYEILKTDFESLQERVDRSLVSRSIHHKALYIWHNPEEFESIDKAWAFWYLANWSFASKLGGGLKYSNDLYSSVPKQMKQKKRAFTIYLQKKD